MESFDSLFSKYCKTTDPNVSKEIIKIVQNRKVSVAGVSRFNELTSEVRQLLINSNDCEIISYLLLLLTQICSEAEEETAEILQIVDQLYSKDSSGCDKFHAKYVRNCNPCDMIQHFSAYLSKNVLVKLLCSNCDKMARFYVRSTCDHIICKACWVTIRGNLAKWVGYSYPCPIDGSPIYKFCEVKELKLFGTNKKEEGERGGNQVIFKICLGTYLFSVMLHNLCNISTYADMLIMYEIPSP